MNLSIDFFVECKTIFFCYSSKNVSVYVWACEHYLCVCESVSSCLVRENYQTNLKLKQIKVIYFMQTLVDYSNALAFGMVWCDNLFSHSSVYDCCIEFLRNTCFSVNNRKGKRMIHDQKNRNGNRHL